MVSLWCEKYRPQTVSDCILRSDLKETLQKIVDEKNLPNLLFSGSAGCGKTTAAKAICRQLGYDCLFLNASMTGNIDTVRVDIQNFASSVSLNGGLKVVILDEADNITPAAQSALRGFIEEFHKNCRFIFTCNYPQKIIEPLHSRCSCIDFTLSNKDKKELVVECFKRIQGILKAEKAEADNKVLIEVIAAFFPDFRRLLNELQKYSLRGKIDSGILSQISSNPVAELVGFMKAKNFTEIRKWAGVHSDMDPNTIITEIYKTLETTVTKSSIPSAILTLFKYMSSVPNVADKEILITSMAAELMLEQEFV